jgi:hypothetical protein
VVGVDRPETVKLVASAGVAKTDGNVEAASRFLQLQVL